MKVPPPFSVGAGKAAERAEAAFPKAAVNDLEPPHRQELVPAAPAKLVAGLARQL